MLKICLGGKTLAFDISLFGAVEPIHSFELEVNWSAKDGYLLSTRRK